MLAGVFHWSYREIMELGSEEFKYSLKAAEKFLKWKTPKSVK